MHKWERQAGRGADGARLRRRLARSRGSDGFPFCVGSEALSFDPRTVGISQDLHVYDDRLWLRFGRRRELQTGIRRSTAQSRRQLLSMDRMQGLAK